MYNQSIDVLSVKANESIFGCLGECFHQITWLVKTFDDHEKMNPCSNVNAYSRIWSRRVYFNMILIR